MSAGDRCRARRAAIGTAALKTIHSPIRICFALILNVLC